MFNSIKINDTDIKELINWDSLSISKGSGTDPDTASFTMVGNSTLYTPQEGDELEIIHDSIVVFGGVVIETKNSTDENLIEVELEFKGWIEQLDNRNVAELYDHETVDNIVADLHTKYFDDYDISGISDSTEIPRIVFDNISVAKALDAITVEIGQSWRVDAEKNITFFASNSSPAPFDLTDDNGSHINDSLEFGFDYTQIRNRVIISGKNIPDKIAEVSPPPAQKDLREWFNRDETITTEEQAQSVADAYLAAYKDPIPTAEFETRSAGLEPGQTINIQSDYRSHNEDYIIQSIDIDADSPFDLIYKVSCASQRILGLQDILRAQKTINNEESPDASVPIEDQNYLQDIEFIAVDFETITWTAGTLRLSDGTAYAIEAGGATLTSDHVIYFEPSVADDELQITDNFATGIGTGKIPIVYAFKNAITTRGADIIPTAFGGKIQLDGAVHITDRSIVADKLAVNELSAITADLGTVTAGTIIGATFKTANDDERIEISGTSLRGYDENDYLRTKIENGLLEFASPWGVTARLYSAFQNNDPEWGWATRLVSNDGILLFGNTTNSVNNEISIGFYSGAMNAQQGFSTYRNNTANTLSTYLRSYNSNLNLVTVTGGNIVLDPTDGVIRPSANNSKALGTTTFRYSNIYSVLANFSSTVTMAGNATIGGNLTLSGNLEISGSINGFQSTGAIYINSNSTDVSNYTERNIMQGQYQWITRVAGTNIILTKSGSGGNKNMIQFYNQSAQAGVIYVNALTTTYQTTSDRRLKKGIVDTKYSLKDLMKIKVRDFTWVTDENAKNTGFVAQELYEVYPPAVTKPDVPNGKMPTVIDPNSDTSYVWGVDYSKLTPLLVQAVQDLAAEVEALKLKLI